MVHRNFGCRKLLAKNCFPKSAERQKMAVMEAEKGAGLPQVPPIAGVLPFLLLPPSHRAAISMCHGAAFELPGSRWRCPASCDHVTLIQCPTIGSVCRLSQEAGHCCCGLCS